MKKLINLLRGYVELMVTGAFPERLLNLCAQNRLQFWKLCWIDETSFTFRIALKDRKRLDELAQRSMCELNEKGRRGAAAVAERIIERRWGFVIGVALCFFAVSFLSRFLLVIEVTGNGNCLHCGHPVSAPAGGVWPGPTALLFWKGGGQLRSAWFAGVELFGHQHLWYACGGCGP